MSTYKRVVPSSLHNPQYCVAPSLKSLAQIIFSLLIVLHFSLHAAQSARICGEIYQMPTPPMRPPVKLLVNSHHVTLKFLIRPLNSFRSSCNRFAEVVLRRATSRGQIDCGCDSSIGLILAILPFIN